MSESDLIQTTRFLHAAALQNRFDQLGDLPEDVDDCWNSVSSTIRDTTGEVIGTRKKIRKPWLSADTFAVVEEKARAKARKDYPERKRLQGVFKAKAKADREAYLTAIIDEVEKDLQCNRLGSAFKAIKQISGKPLQPRQYKQSRRFAMRE